MTEFYPEMNLLMFYLLDFYWLQFSICSLLHWNKKQKRAWAVVTFSSLLPLFGRDCQRLFFSNNNCCFEKIVK